MRKATTKRGNSLTQSIPVLPSLVRFDLMSQVLPLDAQGILERVERGECRCAGFGGCFSQVD